MSNQSPEKNIGVMHLVDTLNMGGTERVAINLANLVPRDKYRSFLCTTRREGPLAKCVASDVGRLRLDRRRRFDVRAVSRLVSFIRRQEIGILHAHGTSVFTANMAALFPPFPKIVWHDHFGTNERRERSVWLYRQLTRRASAVLAVSQPLADWSRQRLEFPRDRVWCLPNCVDCANPDARSSAFGRQAAGGDRLKAELQTKGRKGTRIVCVANLRPVKDHLTLLRAMKQVLPHHPDAHLLLVGNLKDQDCHDAVEREIVTLELGQHVSVLGPREDVSDILRACDVGVLSSTSEGLPVSLLEYGAAGLPVVVTSVGQCADVVDGGRAGLLVSPRDPRGLAGALVSLLNDQPRREALGKAFRVRVQDRYSGDTVIRQLCAIYDTVLQPRSKNGC